MSSKQRTNNKSILRWQHRGGLLELFKSNGPMRVVSYPETSSSPSQEKAQDRTGDTWLVKVCSNFIPQSEDDKHAFTQGTFGDVTLSTLTKTYTNKHTQYKLDFYVASCNLSLN